VLALRKWIENNLEETIVNNQLSNYEKIEHADAILLIAFNELVREISYHCIERG